MHLGKNSNVYMCVSLLNYFPIATFVFDVFSFSVSVTCTSKSSFNVTDDFECGLFCQQLHFQLAFIQSSLVASCCKCFTERAWSNNSGKIAQQHHNNFPAASITTRYCLLQQFNTKINAHQVF